MIEFPDKFNTCVASFSKLPGVGEKTATRQVMAMTKWEPADLEVFSEAAKALSQIGRCLECDVYSDKDLCSICSSYKRKESGVICVVESITDLMAIENSNTYDGVFHILGGVLNPLAGIGPKELRIDKLVERIKQLDSTSLVLAVNPSVEGDATCSYIKQLVGDVVSVQRIGFGVPMGGSLEFLDPLTISKALENRKVLD